MLIEGGPVVDALDALPEGFPRAPSGSEDRVKITDIKITPPLGHINRDWRLLKISADEGIDGLGSGSVGRTL